MVPERPTASPPLKLLGVLRAVRKLTLEGIFHADIAATYPLDEVANAVRAATAPGRTGKVLLRIGTR